MRCWILLLADSSGEQSPLEARFGTGGILHTIENRAMLDSKMTIQTKSIMKRRVNRARPSGLVCPQRL